MVFVQAYCHRVFLVNRDNTLIYHLVSAEFSNLQKRSFQTQASYEAYIIILSFPFFIPANY